MSKYRQAAKIDTNQPEIVKALRQIPGVTVETGKDDILVGYQGKTYWYEIKDPSCLDKTGNIRATEIKEHQQWLEIHWRGHYEIVTSLKEILHDMGIERG